VAQKSADNGRPGNLTDSQVRDLPAPANGNRITYDATIKGFGVRVTAAGAKSFVLNYRAGGRERRITIGSFPAWNVKAARDQAATLRRRIDLGEDPMAERDEARAAPLLSGLWEAFEADHLSRRRPSTQIEYRREAAQYILPRLGQRRVADIEREDIAALHREIAKKHPYQANRVLALLSVLFNLAIEREMRTDNPAARIPKAPEERRERFLNPPEIARLMEALAANPEKISAAAIKFLLLTGARRAEALGARGGEFDLDAGVWTKPSANTKQKRVHRVPISGAALDVLREMKEEAARLQRSGIITPYVFPSVKRPAEPLQEVRRTWATACKAAALTGVRLHDLRHSFASALVSDGIGLPTIGAMLGHSQPRTTSRYAHLYETTYETTLRDAAERVGALVVPMTGKRAR